MQRMPRWNRSLTRRILALSAPVIVAGSALTDPISVKAQTITPAELIGSWMAAPDWQLPYSDPDSLGAMEMLSTYNANHTWRSDSRWRGVVHTDTLTLRWSEAQPDSAPHWVLHGDTLLTFYDAKDTLPTRPKDRNGPEKALVTRAGDQLMLAWLGGDVCSRRTDTLRLVDLSKLPPPPAKPPITVAPAALAGTWVATWKEWRPSRDSLVQSDSLILGADKTARSGTRTGTWALYPGDLIGVSIPLDPKAPTKLTTLNWRALTAQGQLVLTRYGQLCNSHDVYKKVSP